MSIKAPEKPVHLYWHKDRCTTCLSCMAVCAERHTGMTAPLRARLRVVASTLGDEYSAQVCRQCRKPGCANACPAEAIHFDLRLRAWLVDDGLCTGCGNCVEACKFGAIQLDPVSGLAAKCDLCQGAAWCTQVCQTHALVLKGQEE